MSVLSVRVRLSGQRAASIPEGSIVQAEDGSVFLHQGHLGRCVYLIPLSGPALKQVKKHFEEEIEVSPEMLFLVVKDDKKWRETKEYQEVVRHYRLTPHGKQFKKDPDEIFHRWVPISKIRKYAQKMRIPTIGQVIRISVGFYQWPDFVVVKETPKGIFGIRMSRDDDELFPLEDGYRAELLDKTYERRKNQKRWDQIAKRFPEINKTPSLYQ